MPRSLCRFALVMTVVLAASALRAEEALNQLSPQEQKTGWQLLFDGKSLDGWRNYQADQVSDGWKIEDGALVRKDKNAGDIITRNEFENFELSLEYKIVPEGNSGLMFHVTEKEKKPWQSGPEVQIQDNAKGHDPQKAGWVYQLYPAEIDATRPAGQWNELRLKITPKECGVWMNGVQYSKFVKGSKQWDERVKASKFAAVDTFGKSTKGHICLQDHGDEVAFRNIKIRVHDGRDFDLVDGKLPIKAEPAFTELEWEGWTPAGEDGRPVPLRPIVLTHAGDGSGRLFLAEQHGVIYTFEPRDGKQTARRFLDISPKVAYADKQNEEGLLGLAMHPKFKENGEFFVYYTARDPAQSSIISRFRVSKDDPLKADPNSEEEIMRIEQPYWNHNGGTIAFGPDGYLYIGLGDGGAGNDPHDNGQNLNTLLGSVLRIDVDHADPGLKYAIPKDNPFVAQQGARGEIWAYGVRNIWRLAFDRANGSLWAADVGQNLFEEINVIVRGGNYGWNRREAAHSFGAKGTGPKGEFREPIWEYDHEVGKSITGGYVYRGQKLPELNGAYVYADYVSGKLYALRYDGKAGKVTGNYAISGPMLPVLSFGEGEDGELYFLVVAGDGRGIYRLVADKP